MNVTKTKLCEVREEPILDKQIRDILDTIIGVVDTCPKNKYIVNRKSFYKEYICNQYEK